MIVVRPALREATAMDEPFHPTPDSSPDAAPSLRQLLGHHLLGLLRDVIVPLRVLGATSIVFLVFLYLLQTMLWVIRWMAHDVLRFPFVGWCLDAIHVLSVLSVAVYFVFSAIMNLHAHWRLSRELEEEAGL